MTTLITHHDMWSDSMTNKLNVLPAIFEKYPKTLHFYTFYSNTHMNWLKPCHLSILTSLVTTSGVFLWEKVECLPAIWNKQFKISFFARSKILNCSKPYHVITLISHHDVWSVSLINKFQCFISHFWEISQTLLFLCFCHNTKMN